MCFLTPTTGKEERQRAEEEEQHSEHDMSSSPFEIDFFQMEKQSAAFGPSSPDRPPAAPFRGIQGLVSRINPQLLKTVMASGVPGAPQVKPFLSPRQPSPTASCEASLQAVLPQLSPAHNTASRPAASFQGTPETAPLTIFYKGTVVAFDVPRDKAEAIIRMAEAGILVGSPVQWRPEEASPVDGGQLEGDLPIARRKSLQRFLEKRKERYVAPPTEPCASPLPSFHCYG